MNREELLNAAINEYELKNLRFPIKESIYGLKIEELEMKIRTMNCLKRAHMNTIEDFLNNEEKLMHVKGCGITTIKDMKNAILKKQLSMLDESEVEQWVAKVVMISA